MFKIGTAGIPRGAPGTVNGIKRVRELNLDCMELEFVRSVYLSETAAEKVRKAADENDIVLTCHGEYWINLNSKNPETVEASIKRVLNAARVGALAGAKSLTFHPGYRHGLPDEQIYKIIRDRIKNILKIAPKSIRIAPECTGKDSQFGSWEELLKLHKEINCGICFDFSHIWARERGKVDFNEVLNKIKKDYKWYKDMHMHMSGIKYGNKGELNHQMFEDTEFPWQKVASLLSEKGFGGIIICESPNAEKDALILKEYLTNL